MVLRDGTGDDPVSSLCGGELGGEIKGSEIGVVGFCEGFGKSGESMAVGDNGVESCHNWKQNRGPMAKERCLWKS